MYESILMSNCIPSKPIVESLEINVGDYLSDDEIISESSQLYTEAVFVNGKKNIEEIEKIVTNIRNILLQEIEVQKKGDREKDQNKKIESKFNPQSFWKNQEFKNLENQIQKTFGFRSVSIEPYVERYNSTKDQFESNELNAMAWMQDRFPIDGLVTDNGFMDKTHSINMSIYVSLGIIKTLTPGEIVAVLLHEFGHNIDPALMTISYAETNALSKYLTDRTKSLTKTESKVINGKKSKLTMIIELIMKSGLVSNITNSMSFIFGKLGGKNKIPKKLSEEISRDCKKEFNRITYSEAFADNFARMYGYGPQLASALKKMSKDTEKKINSRYKREKLRQKFIVHIISNALKDEHKTEIHRIKALIREYHNDMNDPNIPDEVKKQFKADVTELEKILDSYMNDFSDFQNSVHKLINDEISKYESKSDDKEEYHKEGFEFFDESKKAYEELKKREDTITSSERAEIKKRFGNSKACSFAKDKDGYYAYTHRCRSKSYPSIDKIPMKDVEFVRSTA